MTLTLSTSELLPYPVTPSDLLNDVIGITRQAGSIIMNFREQIVTTQKGIDFKSDKTILTIADTASNDFLTSQLQKIIPGIVVVSEENNLSPQNGKPYWIIDPLDGTKIFANGGTGFGINGALIIDGSPVLGVVDCPALNTTYFSAAGMPAFKQVGNNPAEVIKTCKADPDNLRVAFDGAHGNLEIYKNTALSLREKFNINLPDTPMMERSVPLNMSVAEGIIDLHVKTGRDKTLRGSGGFAWDNAAGHIIIRNAGGGIVDLYNLHNGFKPYDKIGRDRMHGYMAFGDRELRDKIFPNYPSLKKP